MSKSRWAPYYLTKKEILQLEDYQLINAFEQAITDVTIQANCRAKITQKAAKNVEWIREELLTRLKAKE